jgi:hypothetical protein
MARKPAKRTKKKSSLRKPSAKGRARKRKASAKARPRRTRTASRDVLAGGIYAGDPTGGHIAGGGPARAEG